MTAVSDSLADELAGLQPINGCSVCRWLSEQTERDRAAIDEWLAAGRGVTSLWRVCRDRGLTIGRRRFAEHVADCRVDS
ncbi:hypothetical protein I5G67_gp035 [Mycobacterium phage Aminay]|uniref:Uncharacterized protein n=1 Tax=Mycobacterium phage Aminay TaxID=2250291 RepID=A0A345KV21_9CAUD|nr:hypothetical protein I5G67_gp035 [Mycobacterium phage Aminay]AXH46873.1 hypothetical protein SEA_AMINAY_35 [Mycobacterium phage Aminay]